MSDQKKVLSVEAIRKQIFRAKQREQLGDAEYKKQQAEKKKAYRAKIKASKTPQEQVVQQVVQQVIEQVTPAVVKQVAQESKSKITNFFKPATKIDDKSKITGFFKPITKDQYLKNIKNEPIKDLIKEINTTFKKSNSKPKIIISDNIEEEIQKIRDSKKIASVQPLHVKYEGKKKSESDSHKQYLNKLRMVYKMMFNEKINDSIINELQKLMDGKTYNQGIINHIQFFKNINKIINVIKAKYTNPNTLSSYINAITSILSRVREYFPQEYDKIAVLNNDLAKTYNRGRDTNDAPDEVIDKLISFDPKYINELINGITNINDKALIAIYTLTPPRRIMDYQLMKITHQTDIEKLKPGFNYIVIENGVPSLFVFLRHKTQKSQPEPKITIPTDLATILNTYINSNDINRNDFLFGTPTTDFKKGYSQPHFTEKLQKTFFKYTGKKISVNLIRASESTHLDTQPISLAERKQIAQQMGHSLSTNMQYSKHIGVKRLNKNPVNEPAKVEKPTIKRNDKRSTTKVINYDENKKD